MSAKTAAEMEAMAKLAYLAFSRIGDTPWEELPSLMQERWRAVARALDRAVGA